VWYRRGRRSLLVPSIAVAAIWTFVILLVTIPSKSKSLNQGLNKYYVPTVSLTFFITHITIDLMAPAQYWCWVNATDFKYQIGTEYAWMWVAGFGSFLLYIPLAFLVLGFITVEPEDPWWYFRVHRRQSDSTGAMHLPLIMIVYEASLIIFLRY
jgi:hypothetical protein